MLKRIAGELKRHVPFTVLGAVTGIALMAIIVVGNVPAVISQAAFYILHPAHVLLSALATTAMYRRYSNGRIWAAIFVGYIGAIGIATISDAIIPYLGGTLLQVEMEFHVPFIETEKIPFIGIEEWKLVNSLALVGIALGYWKQVTKFPHFGHVLLSTWASLFYFVAFGITRWIPLLPYTFLFLFLAVWLPCCLSDIVLPLLFTKGQKGLFRQTGDLHCH